MFKWSFIIYYRAFFHDTNKTFNGRMDFFKKSFFPFLTAEDFNSIESDIHAECEKMELFNGRVVIISKHRVLR